MKLAVLFTGGKDSTLALMRAMEFHEIACLITIIPENKFSYMFHSSNIKLTKYQAKAMNLNHVLFFSKGEREVEINDLFLAIKQCKKDFNLDGIVSGAIKSVYQAARIQKVCKKLNLFCFNPLWLMDKEEEINEIEKNEIEAIITQVSSYPLNENYLGKKITREIFDEFEKNKINFAGEGGEYETFVTNAKIFKKKIKILKYEKFFNKSENFGYLLIKKLKLVKK